VCHDNIAENLGEFIAKYTRGFDQAKERQNALILSARSYMPVQPEEARAAQKLRRPFGDSTNMDPHFENRNKTRARFNKGLQQDVRHLSITKHMSSPYNKGDRLCIRQTHCHDAHCAIVVINLVDIS
jgi:hypothetical protein